MKKKNPKDNLEDLFSSYFNDADKINQERGWNSPSDDVWESIQRELAEEKKPRRRFFYWSWVAAAASILLLISVFQLQESKEQIKNLSKQLTENEQVIKEIRKDIQSFNKEKEGVNNEKYQAAALASKKEGISKTPHTHLSKTKEKIAFNTINAVVHQANDSSSPNVLMGEGSLANWQSEPIITKKHTEKEKKEPLELMLSNSAKPSKAKEVLHPMNRPLAEALFIELRIINWVNNSSTPIKPLRKKLSGLYVSADYSPVWTTVKSKGFKFGKSDFFPRREIQETAHTFGLKIGKQLNRKWTLEMGLGFTSVQTHINHKKRVPFRYLEEELRGNGNFESNLNLQLASSGGAVDTDISLARSTATTVDENAQLNFNINYTNSLKYLEFPIMVKREWMIGALGLSLKAGILNRYLIQKKFELENVALDDVRFNSRTTSFRERPNSKLTKNYTAHYLVGVGVAYAIQPNLSIYVEPTFSKSIQPLINIGSGSLYQESKTLQVGIRYHL